MLKFDKFWQNRSNFGYLLQKCDFLKITQVRIFSSRMKLESCNFIQVYLYMVFKNSCKRFLIFFFLKYHWLCPKFLTFFQFCPQFCIYFKKRSKIQKSFPWIFRYYIEYTWTKFQLPLASFLKKNVWGKNEYLRDFEKIACL